MVCFRGVTKMYAAGKHFVEVNKMVTAEVLRPAGAARSKGLGLTFYRVAVSQNRHSLVPLKKGLLWGVTLSTVQQTICAEVVFRLWCSTAALDQRVDCCFSSHKLSPSL